MKGLEARLNELENKQITELEMVLFKFELNLTGIIKYIL